MTKTQKKIVILASVAIILAITAFFLNAYGQSRLMAPLMSRERGPDYGWYEDPAFTGN